MPGGLVDFNLGEKRRRGWPGAANGSRATPESTKMSWGAIEDFGSDLSKTRI